jgi:hypothetical protein
MLLNSEGDLYYFDVDVVAETAGTAYNINADELATIANIDTAARVTNKTRFREGEDEDDVEEYIGNLDKSLTEKSLVTVRGIASRIGNTFSEVTRLGVVGFGDELMTRDILKGGSLGKIIGFGDIYVAPDGDNKFLSRRLYDPTADFITMLGPVGAVKGFVVTVIDAFGPSTSEKVRDLEITRVIDATRIEVKTQELYPASGTRKYIVRRRELSISGMPGGIVIYRYID